KFSRPSSPRISRTCLEFERSRAGPGPSAEGAQPFAASRSGARRGRLEGALRGSMQPHEDRARVGTSAGYPLVMRRQRSRLALISTCVLGVSLAGCKGASSGESSAAASDAEAEAEAEAAAEADAEAGEVGGGECPHAVVGGDPEISFELVASGYSQPTFVVADPRDASRLFVGEKGGQLTVLAPGASERPGSALLSLSVETGSEMGLLGMALHPDFPEDPRFYVNYNPAEGENRTRIAEFRFSALDPFTVDASSERVLLEFPQPYRNHDGGQVAFGPDGYLYIGVGDGGDRADPLDAGLDLSTLLGKILRISVDPEGANPYGIPADNPLVEQAGARGEVWAYGLRNPWRFSYDREDGTLYAADVGQDLWAEVDVIVK